MKNYKSWDDAYLQHRLTVVDDNDRLERFVSRVIKCVVAVTLISVSVIAWLIYKGVTT